LYLDWVPVYFPHFTHNYFYYFTKPKLPKQIFQPPFHPQYNIYIWNILQSTFSKYIWTVTFRSNNCYPGLLYSCIWSGDKDCLFTSSYIIFKMIQEWMKNIFGFEAHSFWNHLGKPFPTIMYTSLKPQTTIFNSITCGASFLRHTTTHLSYSMKKLSGERSSKFALCNNFCELSFWVHDDYILQHNGYPWWPSYIGLSTSINNTKCCTRKARLEAINHQSLVFVYKS
jgi:hypothetical protein